MKIASIPYHDWRKIQQEGSRTRDSHIISHLCSAKNVDEVIILNRPLSIIELIIKKRNQGIVGEKIASFGGGSLYILKNGAYLFDYICLEIFSPMIKRKAWFFEAYSKKSYIKSLNKCLEKISLDFDVVLNQNVFAAGLVKNLKRKTIFDAWDNFVLFPDNQLIKDKFLEAYNSLARTSKIWVTNANKNIVFYNENYHPSKCVLIKNGVDVSKFQTKYNVPEDLKGIEAPIVGFGGKITHLFDYTLFNYITKVLPEYNFVIVGQVLDKDVFSKISFRNNVFYLGDKHYSDYPNYVTNFNIGIIPYVTNHLEHGADSIKMYEYIAAGLKVVATGGAGTSDMSGYIKIANSKEKFAKTLKMFTEDEPSNFVELPSSYTWKEKTMHIVKLFNEM